MAASWSCGGCGVTASFGAQTPAPEHPAGWAQEDGEWRCLRCRREQVMERTCAADGADSKARRRRALTEFELLRDPDAADHMIAKRVRCSTAMVRPVRAALDRAGKLPH